MANKQNPPRNHHYVPQLLLRRFTDADGRLWIYDLTEGKIHRGSPKAAGFTRDLYATTSRDGKSEFGLIEAKITKEIDGPGARAIARLLQRETLGEDWDDFLRFVAAQHLRTPAFLERISSSMKPIMQEMLERMAKHEPKFREGVRQDFLKLGLTEEQIESHLQSVGEGRYRIEPHPQMVLGHALNLISEFHEELVPMKWQIAQLEESEPDLMIGDHPALAIVPSGEHVALRNPKIDLILPLSKRVAAIGNWDGMIAYGTLARGQSDSINRDTMRHAKRFIFASTHSEELLKAAQALHGTGPRLHTRRVTVDGKSTIVNEWR